jgi:hypothetical protein
MDYHQIQELEKKCAPLYSTINNAIERINMLSTDVQFGSLASDFNVTFIGFDTDVVRSLLEVIENSQTAIKTIHNSYK